MLGDDAVEETVEWRHRPTHAIDPETGQGDAHVQFAFSAHRAVVDVDVELGLVKVVALDTAQDVGKAINPDAVVGQIHGGSAQGMGLALMEEIVVTDGHVRNPSFTDYLIPTILDMPPMQVEVLEYADPHAPYGVRGVGEPPTISSGPAVAAADPGRRRASRCAGCRSARSTSPAPDSRSPRVDHRLRARDTGGHAAFPCLQTMINFGRARRTPPGRRPGRGGCRAGRPAGCVPATGAAARSARRPPSRSTPPPSP